MGLADEGSVTFFLQHEHRDWPTNDHAYAFPPLDTQGVKAAAVKHSDKTLELRVSGPFGREFSFHCPMPVCDERGLFVAVTWKAPQVKLYLNGVEVEAQDIPDSTDPNDR